MGCLVTVLARLALLVVWVFTPLMSRAFHGGIEGFLLPLVGFLLLPLTTLVYVLVYVAGSGVTGWSWLWVILALLVDLGSHGSGAYANRHRIPGYRASGRGPYAHGG